jgi:U3 small nucleolar RNA-associated protein 19
LIEAELGKEMKKTPVVEFEIPKKIFTPADIETSSLQQLMMELIA